MTSKPALAIVKAHGYGNDFLFVRLADVEGVDVRALARAVCDRHRGIGADGLILFTASDQIPRARMRLVNSDGSDAEVSGNGVRCLAALVAEHHALRERGAIVAISTDAGFKSLQLMGVEDGVYTFCAEMGEPASVKREALQVLDRSMDLVTLSMGNPQCVALGPLPPRDEFLRLGPAIERHPRFPAGTNVEFAEVVSPGEIRILIWERGAGETQSSGTGSCAAAVAASAFAGSGRDVQVTAPGGTQRVEWREDTGGVYLTGWAAVVMRGEWTRPLQFLRDRPQV